MIFMPIIMVLPILALLLFHYFSLDTALPIYIVIMIVAGYCYVVMIQSMRTKAKTGFDALVGKEALVVKDIDPEGMVEILGETWTATARGDIIVAGSKVRVTEANGMVLTVESLDQAGTLSADEKAGTGGR